MTKIKYRSFCKHCNNYKVFEQVQNIYKCCECSNNLEDVDLSNIPDDLIIEQRNRYRESYLSRFMNELKIKDGSYDNEYIMIDDDAGLNLNPEFYKESQATIAKEYHKYKTIKFEKFKTAGRNDICPCGSKLKYKKCCLR